MDPLRWILLSGAMAYAGIGWPWRLPWERGCLAISFAILGVMIIIGPAKERA